MSIETETNQETEIQQEQAIEVAPQDDAPAAELAQDESQDAGDEAFAAGFSGEEAKPIAEPEPDPEEQSIQDFLKEFEELKAKAAEIDKLKEREQRIYGTLGSLKQSIDQLRSQPRPSATAVQVTKEKFAKLGQMFPEMAELLAEDLNGVLTGVGATPADPSQFEQTFDSKLTERLQQSQQAMQQQFEAKVLTVMHPDWRQVVPSPEFQQWKQSLPEETRAELDTSWDAEFIGSKLNEFKDWKSKATQGQQAKQRRLEAAITPKGGAQAPVPTVEDAFIQGFLKG